MNEDLKSKGRNILKKRKCDYCSFRCKSLKELRIHEEEVHGHYKKPKKRRKRKNYKDYEKKIIIMNGVTYEENPSRNEYNEKTPIETSVKNKEMPYLSISDDGHYFIRCVNCNRIKRLTHNPYQMIIIVNGVRKHRDMSKYEYPLLLCPHCESNLFVDGKINSKKRRRKKAKGEIDISGLEDFI